MSHNKLKFSQKKIFSPILQLGVLQYSVGAVVVTTMVAKDAGSSSDIVENSGERERGGGETEVIVHFLESLSLSVFFGTPADCSKEGCVTADVAEKFH